eukprot:12036.XXX_663898_662404_1 [CDS] Oithona nana genome sequencing.
MQFKNCDANDIESEDCPTCISSQKSCPSESFCNKTGICKGTLVSSHLASKQTCHQLCQRNNNCKWHSHGKEGICLLFSDCEIEDDQNEFITDFRLCPKLEEKPLHLRKEYIGTKGVSWKTHIFKVIDDPDACYLYCHAYENCHFFLHHHIEEGQQGYGGKNYCLLGSFETTIELIDLSFLRQVSLDSLFDDITILAQKPTSDAILSKYETLTDPRFTSKGMSNLIFIHRHLGPNSEALCAQLCLLSSLNDAYLERTFYAYHAGNCSIGDFIQRKDSKVLNLDLDGPLSVYTNGLGTANAINRIEDNYKNMMKGSGSISSNPFGSYGGTYQTRCGGYQEITDNFTLEMPENRGPGGQGRFCVWKIFNANPQAKLRMTVERRDRMERTKDIFWVYYGAKDLYFPVDRNGYGKEAFKLMTSDYDVNAGEGPLTFEWTWPAVTIIRINRRPENPLGATIEVIEE